MDHKLAYRVSSFGPKAYPTLFEVNENLETTHTALTSPFNENKSKLLTLPRGTKAIIAKPIPIIASPEKSVEDYLFWDPLRFLQTFYNSAPLGLVARAISRDSKLSPTHPITLQQQQQPDPPREPNRVLLGYTPLDNPGEIKVVAAHPSFPILAIATTTSRIYIHDERNEHKPFASFHLEPAKVYGRVPQITTMQFSKNNELAVGLDSEVGQVDLWSLDFERISSDAFSKLIETEEDTKMAGSPITICRTILLPPGLTDVRKNYIPVPVSGPVKLVSFSQSLSVMAIATSEEGSGVFLFCMMLGTGGRPFRILSHLNILGKLKPEYCTTITWAPAGSAPGAAQNRAKWTKSQYDQQRDQGNMLLLGTNFGNIHVYKLDLCGAYLTYQKVGVFNASMEVLNFSKQIGMDLFEINGGITNLIALPKQLDHDLGDKDHDSNKSTTCLATFEDFPGIVSFRFTKGATQEVSQFDPWVMFIVMVCNLVLCLIYALQWIYDIFNPMDASTLLYRSPRDMDMEVEGFIETPYITQNLCPDVPKDTEMRRLPRKQHTTYKQPEFISDAKQWKFITPPILSGKRSSGDKTMDNFDDGLWFRDTESGRSENTGLRNTPYTDKQVSEIKNQQYKNKFGFGGMIESMAIDAPGGRLLVSFVKNHDDVENKLGETSNIFLFKLEHTTIDVKKGKPRSAAFLNPSDEQQDSLLGKANNNLRRMKTTTSAFETPHKIVTNLRNHFTTPRKRSITNTTAVAAAALPNKTTKHYHYTKKSVTAIIPLGAITPDTSAFSHCEPKIMSAAAQELLSPWPIKKSTNYTSPPPPPFSSFSKSTDGTVLPYSTSFQQSKRTTNVSKAYFINGSKRLTWDSSVGCYIMSWYSNNSFLLPETRFRADCIVRIPVGGYYPNYTMSDGLAFRLEEMGVKDRRVNFMVNNPPREGIEDTVVEGGGVFGTPNNNNNNGGRRDVSFGAEGSSSFGIPLDWS